MLSLSKIFYISRETSFSKLIFYIILFYFPISLKKIFFSGQSFIGSFHVFYNSYFFYLTDLLIFGLILSYLWEKRKDIQSFHKIFTSISQDKIYGLGLWFLAIALLSVLFISRETNLAIYGFLRLFGSFLLFVYIRENIIVSREIRKLGLILVFSASLQAIIGIIQYLTQESVGLKILGEEVFRAGMRGVAEFYTHGLVSPFISQIFPYLRPVSRETINIRAYGTLSHPNILSGILFLAGMVNLFLIYNHQKLIVSRETKGFLIITLGLIIFGLTITFSRTTWIVTITAIFLWFMSFIPLRQERMRYMQGVLMRKAGESYQPGNLALVLLVVVVSGLLSLAVFGPQIKDRLFFKNPRQTQAIEESLADRGRFGEISIQMIKAHPLVGVGMRNFVARMDEYADGSLLAHQFQPVHNIFLLIAAELGLLGLLIFILFLYNIVRHGIRTIKDPIVKRTLVISFTGLLVIGIFDHYVLTILPGMIVFWLVLGLLAAKKEEAT